LRTAREAELAARKVAVDINAQRNPVLEALARAKAKQQEPKP
jgi:electron transport complex protein RnfB